MPVLYYEFVLKHTDHTYVLNHNIVVYKIYYVYLYKTTSWPNHKGRLLVKGEIDACAVASFITSLTGQEVTTSNTCQSGVNYSGDNI
jgi:hypothetical protein